MLCIRVGLTQARPIVFLSVIKMNVISFLDLPLTGEAEAMKRLRFWNQITTYLELQPPS